MAELLDALIQIAGVLFLILGVGILLIIMSVIVVSCWHEWRESRRDRK